MLDIFAIFAAFGVMGYESIKNSMKDDSYKEKARNKGDKTYIDHKGRYRSVDTDEYLWHDIYNGVDRYVGQKTGRVYWDRGKEKVIDFIKQRNKMLDEKGVPIYWKLCKPYYDNKLHKMRDIHLYEKETDRPFEYVGYSQKKSGKFYSSDYEHFTIVYLDENNGMKSVSEYREDIPIKWSMNYRLGM